MNLNGHAALVTGGGSGLGAETARALARAGAKVTVLDINEAGAQKVAGEFGGLALRCDVSDAKSGQDAVTAARAKHGPARILVNCAGIAPATRIVGRDGPHDLAAFARVINVNLIGTFNMMRLAAADMIALEPLTDGERGVIVSTASVAAFEGQIGQAAYAASKGGVAALTLPAAREFARFGVRVVTVAPGLLHTPMFDTLNKEAQDSLVATTLFPARLGRPDEYARLVLHIADNALLNGEVIRLDGAVRLAQR